VGQAKGGGRCAKKDEGAGAQYHPTWEERGKGESARDILSRFESQGEGEQAAAALGRTKGIRGAGLKEGEGGKRDFFAEGRIAGKFLFYTRLEEEGKKEKPEAT